MFLMTHWLQREKTRIHTSNDGGPSEWWVLKS